jgi:TM2 domain-containing membrane protein YozV
MTPSPIVAAVLVPFVVWRVYKRVNRLMVRQRSQPWRHWIAAILFPLLMVGLAAAALAHPPALAGMAAGIAAGAALGVFGLRKTIYERIGGAFFYTPNAHIGILVSMLFIGRLLYRGYQFYVMGVAQPQDFASSPLTLMVFGVLAGYYTMYAAGLLRWRKKAAATKEST